MKRMLLVPAVLLTAAMNPLVVCAEMPEPVEISLTVMDVQGAEILAQTSVTVTDADEDGVLTAADALYLALELETTETLENYTCLMNEAEAEDLYTEIAPGDILLVQKTTEETAETTETTEPPTEPPTEPVTEPPAAQPQPAETPKAAEVKVNEGVTVTAGTQDDRSITVDAAPGRGGITAQNPNGSVAVKVGDNASNVVTNKDGSVSIVVNGDRNRGSISYTPGTSTPQSQQGVVIDMDGTPTNGYTYVTPSNGTSSYSGGWRTGDGGYTPQYSPSYNDSAAVPVSNTVQDDTTAFPVPPDAALSPDTTDVFGWGAAAAAAGAALVAAVVTDRRRKRD